MLHGRRIAVVVPAYNEERWIAETVATMPAFVDHIVVVDDASLDRTSDEAAAAVPGRAVVVRHRENRGVGASIATGYRRALVLGADAIAVMAGDGQMHPDDLAHVVMPIVRGEADYVKGDRLAHPDVARIMPLGRRLGSVVFSWLTRHAAGLERLSDAQCGYTAISARALAAIDLESLWPRYGYPNDLVGALALAGARIADVPVRPVYRGEASGLRPWHLVTISYVIARVAWRRFAKATPALRLHGPEMQPAAPSVYGGAAQGPLDVEPAMAAAYAPARAPLGEPGCEAPADPSA